MDEKKLAIRARNGDKGAFEMLMVRYEKSLYNYIYRMTGDRELSLDLTQEAFLKSYLSIKDFNARYSFSTWLWRIAHNLVIDHFRKKKLNKVSFHAEVDGEDVEFDVPGNEKSPYEKMLNKERREIIMEALEKIPPEMKELIILRHFNELSYQEIAEVTGLPFHAVKSKLYRAREALRKRLEAYREAL
ncbi:MAG: sigma-70 family RNA polymerase sigma factor [Candidatus Aminicenantes bacterium]|nr:sigma-70 family RNA polymerase sigma factor [Candidatus Aminicenantes bacterium]